VYLVEPVVLTAVTNKHAFWVLIPRSLEHMALSTYTICFILILLIKVRDICGNIYVYSETIVKGLANIVLCHLLIYNSCNPIRIYVNL
jgi:hypothetical protein